MEPEPYIPTGHIAGIIPDTSAIAYLHRPGVRVPSYIAYADNEKRSGTEASITSVSPRANGN